VAAAAAAIDAQQEHITVLSTEREAAAAAVDQARAARDLAQIDLDNTVVRAPVDGIVGNRQVRVGRLVSPGAPLLDIVPIDDVWIVANFKETQVGRIRPGQRVRITVDADPEETFAGEVDSFAPGSGSAFSLLPADNATGNFVRVVQRVPVKIRLVDNPLPGRLVPGLSTRVEIDGGSRS
jgi:membrane fusion protein (multidrug efflux system)